MINFFFQRNYLPYNQVNYTKLYETSSLTKMPHVNKLKVYTISLINTEAPLAILWRQSYFRVILRQIEFMKKYKQIVGAFTCGWE